MKDIALEIAQELRDLEKAAQKRQAARAARKNRRYTLNVLFDTDTSVGQPAPKEAKVTVDRAFYCAQLEACLRVIGSTSQSGSTLDVFNVPLGVIYDISALSLYTIGVFDYFWSIRDSFGDREWTKGKQPSSVLESSVVSPFQLPRRQYLPAGTEVTLEIEPLFAVIGTLTGEGYAVSLRSIEVEFSMVGYEV